MVLKSIHKHRFEFGTVETESGIVYSVVCKCLIGSKNWIMSGKTVKMIALCLGIIKCMHVGCHVQFTKGFCKVTGMAVFMQMHFSELKKLNIYSMNL